ncbi:MAG: PIN domain-containing protein [Methanoregulaceae archaeon]
MAGLPCPALKLLRRSLKVTSSNRIADVPPATRAIFDSNILIYWITDHPRFADSCEYAVRNVEEGKLQGVIPAVILNELLHRLIIAETLEQGFAASPQEAILRIKREPEIISRLSVAWDVYRELQRMPFDMPDETAGFTELTYSFSRDFHLMAKDAAIAAFAHSHSIGHILTNDRDFERVPWLTCWVP